MPVLISPNVYWRELDFSLFVAAFSPTVFGLVFTSPTGPDLTPTLITGLPQGGSTFGSPNPNAISLYALWQYLRRGNQAWAVRIVGSAAEKPENTFGSENASAGTILGTESGPFNVVASTRAAHTSSGAGPYTITQPTAASWQGTGIDSTADVSPIVALTAGSFKINLDGEGLQDIVVNFTSAPAATTLANIGTKIQSALDTLYGSGRVTVTTGGTPGSGTGTLTITSEAYGALGSVVLAQGTIGTDIYNNAGGNIGGDSPVVTAGVNGTNRLLISAYSDGVSIPAAQIETALSGSQTAAAIAASLQASLLTESPALNAVLTFSNSSGSLKIQHSKYGSGSGAFASNFTLAAPTPAGASILSAVSMTANTYQGTNGTDRLRVAVDGGGAQNITLTAGGSRTLAQVANDINTAPLTGAVASVLSQPSGDVLQISSITTGSSSSVQVSDSDGQFAADELLGFDYVLHSGTDAGTPTLKFAERYYGFTDVSVKISHGTDYSFPSNIVYKVEIFQGTNLVNKYDNLRKTAADETEALDLFEVKIGTVANPIDPYVTVEDLQPLVTTVDLPDAGNTATIALTPLGADPSGYSVTSGDITAGIDLFYNTTLYDISVFAAPGFSSSAVVAKLVDLAETRKDMIALVDPLDNLSVQNVAAWHNGTYMGGPAMINSSYCAVYYPWVQIFDSVNNQNVYTPPSGHVAGVFAFSDAQSEQWFAPAGSNRGKLPAATGVRTLLTDGDCDFLLGNNNRVNTIRNFADEGIMVFSQRTTLRQNSQLANLNVRRLLIVARKAIVKAVRSMLFQPNDEVSWAMFEALVNPFLAGIANSRGIREFKVIMNAQTVTPDMRNRNEARGLVLIRPTTSMDKILVDFVLTNQDMTFDSLEDLLF